MTRVLLLCPEPLGHRQPAGVGIRFLELARALVDDGASVAVLSRDGGTVPGCETAVVSAANIRSFSERSDVVVVQGHLVNELVAHGAEIPTVVDLYDPWIVENLHYFRTEGAKVFEHDHPTFLRSLQRGDLFLCASEAQRLFYLGALLAVGRLNPASYEDDPRLDSLIRIVPFGVSPETPGTSRTVDSPHILFGGIYDWYDPLLAIDAVAAARSEIAGLTLTFTTQPNPLLTPQGVAAAALDHVKRNGFESFVFFESWVPYEERASFYARFTAALLTFPRTLETELAMRTRIFDWLWAGLPVITSSAPGTDRILREYDAGIVVETDDAEDFSRALRALLGDTTRYETALRGAARWTRSHQWRRLVEPLLEFCRSPRIDPDKARFSPRETDDPRPERDLIDRIRRRMGGLL